MSDRTHESTGYLIGLDLGQSQDYTALCVVERVLPPRAPRPVTDQSDWRAAARWAQSDTRVASYHVRHLAREPLGTPYTAVVARVHGLLATPPLSTTTPLVIDKTGVGTPVADMFTAPGVQPVLMTITVGDEVIRAGPRHTRVPKRELVGTLVMLFQSERLKIAAGLAEGPTLMNELLNFKMKVNLVTGHDSYEVWREAVHDDLVLAVAVACWHGEDAKKRVNAGVFID